MFHIVGITVYYTNKTTRSFTVNKLVLASHLEEYRARKRQELGPDATDIYFTFKHIKP